MKLLALAFLLASGLTAFAQPATRNVLLVTIDGLRWQEVFRGPDAAYVNTEFGGIPENALARHRAAATAGTVEQRRRELMPFLWSEVTARGQLFGNRDRGAPMRVTNVQWFSYPGYNELLCGAADPLVTSNAPIPNRNVTVLEWLNQQPEFSGKVAACTTWQIFPAILNVGRSRLPVWVSGQRNALAARSPQLAEIDRWMQDIPQKASDEHYDAFGFRAALELVDLLHPRVLYVALGEPDTDAHGRRYGAYLASIQRADRFLRALWEKLQSLEQYRDKTTLVLTTDHGRGRTPKDWTQHDKKTPGSEETWLAVMGPDTAARGERVEHAGVTSSQVAATVAALLGADFAHSSPQIAAPVADVLPAARGK